MFENNCQLYIAEKAAKLQYYSLINNSMAFSYSSYFVRFCIGCGNAVDKAVKGQCLKYYGLRLTCGAKQYFRCDIAGKVRPLSELKDMYATSQWTPVQTSLITGAWYYVENDTRGLIFFYRIHL